MKKLSVLVLAGLVLAGSAFGDVVKKTKSEISFKKFGSFTATATEKISAERRATESENNFKAKGLVGSLAKAFFRSGQFGEIVDLPQMTLTSLDLKRKEYQVRPIGPLPQQTGQESAGRTSQQQQAEDKDIKITRSEFKVQKAGESKTINQFPCEKYVITWLVDWENTRTKEKGSETLNTEVWSTPLSADLKAGRDVEMAFAREYLKKQGLGIEADEQQFLGLNWLSMLASLDPTGRRPKLSQPGNASELKKIQGYPVIVDGKYFTKVEGGAEQQAQTEETGGVLGKLAGGILGGKSKDDSSEPVVSFYTELLEINKSSLGPADFQVPANFKEKK